MDLGITVPTSILLASLIIAAAVVYAARIIAKPPTGHQTIAAGAATGNALMNPLGFPMPLMESPLSAAGFPVEPSGIQVQPETRLEVGSSVLGYSQGRWWRADVIALESGDRVRIRYPGWDSKWDETVPRSNPQVDLGQGE